MNETLLLFVKAKSLCRNEKLKCSFLPRSLQGTKAMPMPAAPGKRPRRLGFV
jgi:hypothetical protein